MAQSIASFAVSIGANTTGFVRGMKRAHGALASFRSSVGAIGRTVTGMGARIAALATGGGLALLVKQQAGQVDALAKLAERTNDTVDNMQALSIAASRAGSSMESVSKAVQIMARNLGNQALAPTATMTESLKRIGLTLEMLKGLRPSEQFVKIGEAISGVADVTERAATASQFFGRGGMELLNVLTSAKLEFQSARRDVEAFGLAVGDDMSRSVQNAKDRLGDVKLIVQGMGRQILGELSEPVRIISERFIAWATAGEAVEGKVGGALRAIGGAVAWVGDKWGYLNLAVESFSALVTSGFALATKVLRAFAEKIETLLNTALRGANMLARFANTYLGGDVKMFDLIDTTQGPAAQLKNLETALEEQAASRYAGAIDRMRGLQSGGAQRSTANMLDSMGFNQMARGVGGRGRGGGAIDPQMTENNQLLRQLVLELHGGQMNVL